MQKKIVTISRQYGSGGRYIGKKLSEKLGIPCYDEKLIDMVAKESGFAQDFVAEKGERMTGSLLFNIASSLSYANNVFSGNGVSLQDEIYFIQNKIIKDLAEKGSCVIVGRCADYILRERDDVLNVFIHADMASKINRAVTYFGITAKVLCCNYIITWLHTFCKRGIQRFKGMCFHLVNGRKKQILGCDNLIGIHIRMKLEYFSHGEILLQHI